jgi:adenylosuccinate lyase
VDWSSTRKVIAPASPAELPFIATENIMMAAAKRRLGSPGRPRTHPPAQPRGRRRHQAQVANPTICIDRLKAATKPSPKSISTSPRCSTPAAYVGRSAEQVDEFIKAHVTPIRRRYAQAMKLESALQV